MVPKLRNFSAWGVLTTFVSETEKEKRNTERGKISQF